jgi:large subunit ribosomal protein L9
MKLKFRSTKLFIFACLVAFKPYDCLVCSDSWIVQRATFVAPNTQTKISRRKTTGYDVLQKPAFCRFQEATILQLSKKKTVPAAVKKIQVKMLKYVEGTGHVGEIVMVTPAFFQNKLRPSASAIMITDEEVMKEKSEAEALEKETRAKAEALKERIVDLSLLLKRKAGPDGHLFGGIGPKCIMEELEKSTNDDFLKQKGVKIISITNEDGSNVNGDIKHTGVFKASLSLTKDISGSFGIIVEAER